MPSRKEAPVDPARLVHLRTEKVHNTASPFFPHHYPATPSANASTSATRLDNTESGSWDLDQFRNGLTTKITRLSSERVEFDLIGVDASIANAIRRVMIAEVPTVAIENVYVFNNTSIIQDEVLSHRLGLVPMLVDPDLLVFKDEGAEDDNTVVFLMKLSCTRKPGSGGRRSAHSADGDLPETDPEKLYENAHAYSGSLKWCPTEAQRAWNWTSSNNPGGITPRAVNERILLAKLRPGQSIEAECHAEKGIGRDHAKFSPVATASYRLLPHIELLEPIDGSAEEQEEFIKLFPEGVMAQRKNKDGKNEVYVADPRRDTVSREVLRHDKFKDKVFLGRVRDHFLCELAEWPPFPAHA